MNEPTPDTPEFRCTVSHVDGRATIAVEGEIDLVTAPQFDAVVREHLPRGPVLLDLSELTFMDSSGIRVFDGLLRDAEAGGWTFALRADLPPPVRRILTLTGLIDVLPVEEP